MKKKISLILILVMLAALLCGCGTKSAPYDKGAYYQTSSADTAPMEPAMAPAAMAEAPMAMYGETESAYGWSEAKNKAEEPVPMPEETGSSLPANVKLIYTAYIELESTEFDTALNGLNTLVAQLGGYFERSELNNYGTYRYGSYTVRVPAQNFEAFCTGAGELCQMNNISRSAEDVSEYYYDTEARLTTQKTKLARLQDLLKQAEDMEDIITLESAISETELAIENLTGTLRKYDSLVGYATVHLTLSEVYKLTEVEEPVIGFGAKLAAAFKSGSTRFARGFENFLLSVARGWIGWLVFIIIVVVVVIIVKKIVRRCKAKAAAQPKKPTPAKAAKPAAAPAKPLPGAAQTPAAKPAEPVKPAAPDAAEKKE